MGDSADRGLAPYMEGRLVRNEGWKTEEEGRGKTSSPCSGRTSEESDRLVTTRAVPASYEPKACHSKEYRRLQADYS